MPEYSRQHVVSRALLRQWLGGESPHILVFDKIRRHERESSPDDVGWVRDFIKVEPEVSEREWGEVEVRLPAALEAVDSGAALDDLEVVDVLGKTLAIHWARSKSSAAIYEQNLPKVLGRVARDMSPAEIEAVYLDLSEGLPPPDGETARTVVTDALERAVAAHFDEGRVFRDLVHSNVQTALERLKGLKIEIGRSVGAEFLIGDIPAVTITADGDAVGPHHGVPWGAAELLVLPLGPKHVLSVTSRESRWWDCPPDVVARLNSSQVAASVRDVFYRPGSGLRPPTGQG